MSEDLNKAEKRFSEINDSTEFLSHDDIFPKFYSDGTKGCGYYAIINRDNDEYIQVDCTKDQLSIFVDALNQEAECQKT